MGLRRGRRQQLLSLVFLICAVYALTCGHIAVAVMFVIIALLFD